MGQNYEIEFEDEEDDLRILKVIVPNATRSNGFIRWLREQRAQHALNSGNTLRFISLIAERLTVFHLVPLALVVVPLVSWLVLATSSELYRIMPYSMDEQLGGELVKLIDSEYEICKDEELNAFLTSSAKKLSLPGDYFAYQIKVIPSNKVNAFALPGGSIYFFSGLIEKSESPEEVIGVLAHEIGHIEKRHGMRSFGRGLGFTYLSTMVFGGGLEGAENLETLAELSNIFLLLDYSREQEKEADADALKRLNKAGISSHGIHDFMKRMSEKKEGLKIASWLSTHPESDTRAEFFKVKRDSVPNQLVNDWTSLKSSCVPTKKE